VATPRNPSVSVVIPAHNAAATIGEQLTALRGQSFIDEFEIVVVGNQCRDATEEVVDGLSAGLPLRYIAADDRVGASYARNVGVVAARGDVVLHCDADDAVDADWVAGMVGALDEWDVVGGALEPLACPPAWAVRSSFVPFVALPTFRGRPYAPGASIGYPRRVHAAIGGFDERFECGADDVAFSLRAQDAGFRVGFAREARCGYRLRTTLREAAAQQRRYGRGLALLTAHYAPELDRGGIVDVGRTVLEGARRLVGARSVDDVRIAFLRTSFQSARTLEMAQHRRRSATGSRHGSRDGGVDAQP